MTGRANSSLPRRLTISRGDACAFSRIFFAVFLMRPIDSLGSFIVLVAVEIFHPKYWVVCAGLSLLFAVLIWKPSINWIRRFVAVWRYCLSSCHSSISSTYVFMLILRLVSAHVCTSFITLAYIPSRCTL